MHLMTDTTAVMSCIVMTNIMAIKGESYHKDRNHQQEFSPHPRGAVWCPWCPCWPLPLLLPPLYMCLVVVLIWVPSVWVHELHL